MTENNHKTAFQLGADAISKIVHPRIHSQSVQSDRDESMAFLAEFRDIVAKIKLASSDASKALIAPLAEDIGYSDPVSTGEAYAYESELMSVAQDCLAKVSQGEEIPGEFVSHARKLLEARNDVCKRSK